MGRALGATIALGAAVAVGVGSQLRRSSKAETPVHFTSNELALLAGNEALFDHEEARLVQMLCEEGQQHLFAKWPAPGKEDTEKRQLLRQLKHLSSTYNGGLRAYIKNAKALLRDSRAGVNPFEDYVPAVPDGQKLAYGSDVFKEYENIGVEEAGHAAFVLVAGGLGERLGYSGIKVALPAESARGISFLQLYVENILAFQAKAFAKGSKLRLPLAIMTSDDTHSRTESFLKRHNYFGAEPSQITLIKQEKVACFSDNDAHLALSAKDPYLLQTKPHGHGDVHALLHSSGLANKWRKQGFKWVCFFQDTNGLVFRGLPAALGVSAQNGYNVNSLAVPRKAKESIGAIALLKRSDGSSMTINVEYNQLDPLLRATSYPDGDVNDATGWSPFPGNINQLVLRLAPYVKQLHKTGGNIAEFVNPKYADASKTAFKSSTRLECMMQDYPKTLPTSTGMGFTVINEVWAAYSPVKNSPMDAVAKVAADNPSHSATAGELDMYQANCRTLQMLGAEIASPTPVTFNGLNAELWPRVVWSPSFAQTFKELAAKVNGPAIKIGTDAMLVVKGNKVELQGLKLNGAMVVRAVYGAEVLIDGLEVENASWAWQPIKQNESCTEEQSIRGFKVVRKATYELLFDKPGQYFVMPQKDWAAEYEDGAGVSGPDIVAKKEGSEGLKAVGTAQSEPVQSTVSSGSQPRFGIPALATS